MALMSRLIHSELNKKLEQDDAETARNKSVRNRKWLTDFGADDGILLLGGASLADFRIRVAQSALRGDMLPSFWSQCGVLMGGGKFASVPLDLAARAEKSEGEVDDVSSIPRTNGVRICSLDEIDDPKRYPNIAVVCFATAHEKVVEFVDRVRHNRTVLDLPSLMLPWLGFIWGTSGAANPLLNGTGLPSSAFVETVYAMANVELTPGLSSASSCPEAIWQSAKWWGGFYASAAKSTRDKKGIVPMVPEGRYLIRQPSATVDWPQVLGDATPKVGLDGK